MLSNPSMVKALTEAAIEIVRRQCPQAPIERACLPLSLTGALLCDLLHLPEPSLVAGATGWRCGEDEEGPLYYSYEWDPLEFALAVARRDEAMSWHCWLQWPGGLVWDISAQFLPIHVKAVTGREWSGPLPLGITSLEQRAAAEWLYQPIPQATTHAHSCADRILPLLFSATTSSPMEAATIKAD